MGGTRSRRSLRSARIDKTRSGYRPEGSSGNKAGGALFVSTRADPGTCVAPGAAQNKRRATIAPPSKPLSGPDSRLPAQRCFCAARALNARAGTCLSRPMTPLCLAPTNFSSRSSRIGSTSSSRRNFRLSPVVSLTEQRARCVSLNCLGTSSSGRESVSEREDSRKVLLAFRCCRTCMHNRQVR